VVVDGGRVELPSSTSGRLGVLGLVALVATAGCLSGPLGSTSGTEATATAETDVMSSTDDADPGPSGIEVHRADPAEARTSPATCPNPPTAATTAG